MTPVREVTEPFGSFNTGRSVTKTQQDRTDSTLGGWGRVERGRTDAPVSWTLSSARPQLISVSQAEPSLRFCEREYVVYHEHANQHPRPDRPRRPDYAGR